MEGLLAGSMSVNLLIRIYILGSSVPFFTIASANFPQAKEIALLISIIPFN